MKKPCFVHAVWDKDAKVWVAFERGRDGPGNGVRGREDLVEKLKPSFRKFWTQTAVTDTKLNARPAMNSGPAITNFGGPDA